MEEPYANLSHENHNIEFYSTRFTPPGVYFFNGPKPKKSVIFRYRYQITDIHKGGYTYFWEPQNWGQKDYIMLKLNHDYGKYVIKTNQQKEEVEFTFELENGSKNLYSDMCWITVHMTKKKIEFYFENELLKTVKGRYNLLHYHNIAYNVVTPECMPCEFSQAGIIDNLELLTDLNKEQKKCVLQGKFSDECKNKGLKNQSLYSGSEVGQQIDYYEMDSESTQTQEDYHDE